MKRLAPFIVIGLVLVGLLVAPFALFRPERFRQPLIDHLSKAFGHPVLISKVEAGYFPPTLKISDLSVLKSGDSRYVHIDRAEATLSWAALVGRVTKPERVTANGFQLTFMRRADGSWDADEWLPVLAGASSQAGSGTTLMLQNGTIRWLDAFAPVSAELTATGVEGRLQATGLSLSGQLGGTPVTTAFKLESTGFWGGRDGQATLHSVEGSRTATATLQRQAGSTTWTVESPEWRVDHVWSLAQFVLRFRRGDVAAGSSLLRNGKGSYVVVASSRSFNASASLDGGVLETKGTVQTQNGVASTQLALALQNVPLPSIAPMLGSWGTGSDGKVTGLLSDFSMELSSRSWESARGNAVFELASGSYRFPSTSLQYLQKARTAQYFRKKYPDLMDKGLPIQKARLVGRIERAGLTVQSAGLSSGSIQAGFSGRLESIQKSIEGYVLLQIHETSKSLVKELPARYVYGEGSQMKIQPIFGRVQGNWAEWKLRSLPKSKIPGAAQRGVRSGASSVDSK